MNRRFLTRTVIPVLLVGVVASACTDSPDQANLEVTPPTIENTNTASSSAPSLTTTTTTPAPPLSFPAPERVFTLPTWREDPADFFARTVDLALATAQRLDKTLGNEIPLARMITRSRDVPCEGRGLRVNGSDPAAPAIWCDVANGQRFYIAEAALNARAAQSSMHATMLVLHAVGEYVLDRYDFAYTPAATACASGYITQLLTAQNLVSNEVAVNEMAYAIPDTDYLNSYQDGFRNGISACRL